MGRHRKYATEEERIEARRKYYRDNKEKILERHAIYRKENKDEILERQAIYRKENKNEILERQARYRQNHKAEIAEYMAKYHREHKDEKAEYDAVYRKNHKEKMAEYKAKWYNTKEGRAKHLIGAYKHEDKKHRRGNCDLTMPWFVRNIFTKCIYCGETDWKKLGADRIDNSKGHTIENVVPACWDCNNNRKNKSFEQFYWESKHKTLGEES